MSERLNEFEDVSSEFESENSGFEVNETRINEEHARQERTPLQKLLDAEVMVEIPNFPYKNEEDKIFTYELNGIQIKILKTGENPNSFALTMSGIETNNQLYSLGYPLIDTSKRQKRLEGINSLYNVDVHEAEYIHESLAGNYFSKDDMEGYKRTYENLEKKKNELKERVENNYLESLNIPDEKKDALTFAVSKPSEDTKGHKVTFNFDCNASIDYLYLPVKNWPLELFKDKEITMFVIENIENTPESKDVWTKFLDANKHQLPMQAYILLTTKAQSLEGKVE